MNRARAGATSRKRPPASGTAMRHATGESVLPDYRGGGIANLMGSISRAYGVKSHYPDLRLLPSSACAEAKNVILFNIDGLGYRWLMEHAPDSALAAHCVGSMTSVFPSTTATATVCLSTGVPAQQHGMTGWFVYLKEIGAVTVPLLHVTRAGKLDLTKTADVDELFSVAPFVRGSGVRAHAVLPADWVDTAFTRAACRGVKVVPYETLDALTERLAELTAGRGRKHIYAYSPSFDGAMHEYGTTHRTTMREFRKLDAAFETLLATVAPDTMAVVTSDHGLIDTPKEKAVSLADHPRLAEMLAAPLCGEARICYCYVKPGAMRAFERYVHTELADICDMVRSVDAMAKGWFGLGTPHPALADRIGDRILVMKDRHTLRDVLVGEKRSIHKASHGALSPEEMCVPLIVARR